MDRGIYIAVAGAINQERVVETITNNLAGAGVSGFKRDIAIFSIYTPKLPVGTFPVKERVFPDRGTSVIDLSQGPLERTGNPLDLAISGEGFFVVQTPEGRRYTRMGNFILGRDGTLQTQDGYPVEGEGGVIRLTQGSISVAGDGTVSVDDEEIGRIRVVTFDDPSVLRKVGKGLFAPSRQGINERPAEEATVMEGYLERSNVNPVKEMVSMIAALRAYEAHLKLIQGFSDVTERTIRAAERG